MSGRTKVKNKTKKPLDYQGIFMVLKLGIRSGILRMHKLWANQQIQTEKGSEQDHCGPNQVNDILHLRNSDLGFETGRFVSKQRRSWDT